MRGYEITQLSDFIPSPRPFDALWVLPVGEGVSGTAVNGYSFFPCFSADSVANLSVIIGLKKH
jgi:hypothetical protein